MKRLILAAILAAIAVVYAPQAGAQAWAGVLSSSRAVDWSGAGVPGGIPSASWTQCGTTIAAYGSSGSYASPSTINSALAACPANTYVLLGAGHFYLTAGWIQKSNVELRAADPTQTIIHLNGLESCGGLYASACFMGANFYYGSSSAAIGGTNSATWTGTNSSSGTYTPGATSIRLTNIGSTGILNGDYIYLDQDDDSAVANGFLVGTKNTVSPPFSLEQGAPGRTNGSTPRSQVLVVKVTAGCGTLCTGAGPFDLTIAAPGVIGKNWRSTQNPGAWFPGPGNTIKNSGVQGITIDYTATGSGTSEGGIVFFNAAENWAYNVRSIKSHRNHTWFWQAAHNTVLSNYFYDSYNASSQSYGTESFIGTANLTANNIYEHITTPIVLGGSIGSAYVYNFGIDSFVAQGTLTVTQTSMSGCPSACVAHYTFSGYSSINGSLGVGEPFSIRGLTNGGGVFNVDNMPISNLVGSTSGSFDIAFASGSNVSSASESATGLVSNGTLYPFTALHDAGVEFNLFEGNEGTLVYGDVFHGTSDANTFARNYFVGAEKSKNVGSEYAFRMLSYHRYWNLVGNVLGKSGVHSSYEDYTGCSGCSGQPVFNLGYGNTNGTVTVSPDTQVRATRMFWGNYDPAHASVQWNSAEVPSGLSDGYANPLPANHTLPASFIFSSKPSWLTSAYGSIPWPVIGPDVTGGAATAPDMTGTTTAPGGLAYDNAAALCYKNAVIDSSYPLALDRGVLSFNAATCYGGGGSSLPTLTVTPNPIAFGHQNTGTTSSPATATVTNPGGAGVTLGNPTYFSITGTNLSDIARSGGTCSAGGTIAAGGNCTILLTFSPGAAGARSARLNIIGTTGAADITGTGDTPGGSVNKVNAALELKNQVPVANGGTGLSAIAAHQVAVGTASNVYTAKTVPNCPDTGGNHLNFTQSGDSITCGTSGATSGTVTTTGSPANGNLTKFSGASSITNGDLSGDVTTSGTLAATVGKVNGVSYGASPSTHTTPVITASNTATYKTLPDCPDTGGNHYNYTQSTDTYSCGTSGSSSFADQQPNFVFAGPVSSGASNLVQSNSSAVGSASSLAVAYNSNLGSSHLLVAFVATNGSTPNTLTSTNNTWTSLRTGSYGSNYAIFYVCSSNAGADTVTFSTSPTSVIHLQIFEFSGNATSSCLDLNTGGSNGNGGTSYSITSGSSVAQATELVLGLAIPNNGASTTTVTASSPYQNLITTTTSTAKTMMLTSINTNSSGLSGTQTVTVTVPSAPTYWTGAIVSFKLNTTGSAAPTFRLLDPSDLPANISVGHAICWRTDQKLGYCSDQPNGSGTCTCN